MLAGDFVLCRAWPNLFSMVVEEATHSDFVHVISCIDGRSYLSPAWPRLTRLAGPLRLRPEHHHLVSPDLTPEERSMVSAELEAMVGQPYGLRAALWVGMVDMEPYLRRFWDPVHVHSTVCSTTVTMAYWRAGCYQKLRLGGLEPHEVSAGDLARAFGIAEGTNIRHLLRQRLERARRRPARAGGPAAGPGPAQR